MSLGSWYEDMSYVTRFMLWQEPCFLTELDIAREKGERRELRKKIEKKKKLESNFSLTNRKLRVVVNLSSKIIGDF